MKLRWPPEGRWAKLGFFVFLVLLYNANLRPIATGDSVPAALTPLAVVLDGTVRLGRFGPWIRDSAPRVAYAVQQRRGGWVSNYSVVGPILVSPAYLPLAAVPGIRSASPSSLYLVARVVEKLVASLLAAASAVLMLALLERLTSRGWAWALALVYAVGTGTWATVSQALWQHTFGAPLLIGCLLSLEMVHERPRRVVWCGILAALAVAVRPTNIVLLPALALGMLGARVPWRSWWATMSVAAVGPALLVSYNLYMFSKPQGEHPGAWGGDVFEGLAGVLVSPGRGLLVYTPVVLLAGVVLSNRVAAARNRNRALVVTSATFVLLQLALLAFWANWWGGHSWGPRLLTETIPFLVVLLAVAVPAIRASAARRTVFILLATYGIIVQAVGAFGYPNGRWDATPVNVDEAPHRLWDWEDNPIARTVRAGPLLDPHLIVGAALTEGLPAARARIRSLGVQF